MTDDVFSMKRLTAILSMVAGQLALVVFFGLWYHFTIDRMLSFVFLQFLFFPVFLLFLELERKKGRLLRNHTSSYRMLSRGFLVTLVLYLGFAFLPSYTAPVMLPAMFLSLISESSVGMVCSFYLDILLCMVSECSYYELAAYMILSMTGCLMAILLEQKKYRIYMNIIILAMSLSIPGLFYYFSSFTINPYIFLYGAAGGVISCFLFLLFYDRVARLTENEIERTLQEIIAPDYSLVKDIQNYSQMDYTHAVHVSKTAYQCAQQIGADADVAAAAGFYYRLGKLEGEPFVDNGVILAKQNCFPIKVITILSEYNGEKKMPSTRESAIVHMADAVITRFELLDKETLSSTWNHDIVIYQTLNEKSASGIYDESGLSMNQYLKIREYLVKGVTLF